MKHLIIFLFLFGCTNRNDIATQLLNDKKATEDSIKDATNNESYYMRRAKEERDSLIWKPLIDSSTYFYDKNYALKKKLKAIEFSLDSISRMK